MLDPAARAYREGGRRGRARSRRAAEDPRRRPRSSPSFAPARIRRRSSCGRSSAICSTTARITWPMSPTTRATSISPFAGASAGSSGPFETWQAAGWNEVAGWVAEDIAAGKALASVPLPAWVSGDKVQRRARRACGGGRVLARPATRSCRAAALPVYRRQLFPDPVLGERAANHGTTIFETDAVRMWHLGDDVGIVSFKTKANTIGEGVLDGLLRAIDDAERQCAGLVIWQTKEPFSLGANLAGDRAGDRRPGQWDAIEAVVAKFQRTAMRLRYSLVPTVCAVRGMALGGSCEFIMHADRTVAALESYIGLVEVGVGLLPAGGGSKELAVRAAEEVRRGANGSQIDQLPFIRTYFQTIATATVAKSALEAQGAGLSAAVPTSS